MRKIKLWKLLIRSYITTRLLYEQTTIPLLITTSQFDYARKTKQKKSI